MTLREFFDACEILGIDMDRDIIIKDWRRVYEPIETPGQDERLRYTISYIEKFTDHIITFDPMYMLTVDGITDTLLTFERCMDILEVFRIEAQEGHKNGHEHK